MAPQEQIETERFVQVASQATPGAASTRSRVSAIQTKNPKVEVDLILVPVTVTDPHERLVMGLTKDNFVLYEGNGEELILHVSSGDAPISLGVIFDTSDSMYGKIEKSREAV